jgi:hypothetical protein
MSVGTPYGSLPLPRRLPGRVELGGVKAPRVRAPAQLQLRAAAVPIGVTHGGPDAMSAEGKV